MQSVVLEDAKHIILECESVNGIRSRLFEDISNMPYEIRSNIVAVSDDILSTLLGKF